MTEQKEQPQLHEAHLEVSLIGTQELSLLRRHVTLLAICNIIQAAYILLITYLNYIMD